MWNVATRAASLFLCIACEGAPATVLHSSVCATSSHVCVRRTLPRCTDSLDVWRSYGGAGALWHIWPRDSRPGMERFLRRHAAEFAREGCSVDPEDILHPIHDQVRPLCPHRTLVYTTAYPEHENPAALFS